MDAFELLVKAELAFGAPLFAGGKLEHGALRVSSVDAEVLCVVQLDAVGPNDDVQATVDGGEVADLLEDLEPRIVHLLTSWVDVPKQDAGVLVS